MNVYGIYAGFDFISIAVRRADSPLITPLLIYPLHRTMDRNAEVSAAFGKIASEKLIRSAGSSVAALAFESCENQLFLTNLAEETPDITEMMSWELFMRAGEPVKEYNISAFRLQKNKYLAAAAKIRDIEFFTKQVKRLGLKTAVIEPPIVSSINIFEANYDTFGDNLIALLGCHKITLAYIKDGNLIDIVQNVIHLPELISSEDIMKTRAEITQKNELPKEIPMFITGDLLADREYAAFIAGDMLNCQYLDPFKTISANENSEKELMDKYSLAFGAAVSLSQKSV